MVLAPACAQAELGGGMSGVQADGARSDVAGDVLAELRDPATRGKRSDLERARPLGEAVDAIDQVNEDPLRPCGRAGLTIPPRAVHRPDVSHATSVQTRLPAVRRASSASQQPFLDTAASAGPHLAARLRSQRRPVREARHTSIPRMAPWLTHTEVRGSYRGKAAPPTVLFGSR